MTSSPSQWLFRFGMLAVLGLSPRVAYGQSGAQGLWVEAGAGGAWNLLRGLEDGSPPNLGGYVRMGGTPVRSLLVGGEIIGWARQRPEVLPLDNLVFAAVNIGVVALFYPLAEWPLYVKGGLGAALVELSVDPLVGFPIPTDHQGIGATLGVGVDALRLGPFGVTPSVSWAGQAFGSQGDNLRRIANNTFLLIALGVRWR